MRIKEKINKVLNDTFFDNMLRYVQKQFPDIKIESEFNIFSLRKQTFWECEDARTNELINLTIKTYEQAYLDASHEVSEA